jgi:hypothetical protein
MTTKEISTSRYAPIVQTDYSLKLKLTIDDPMLIVIGTSAGIGGINHGILRLRSDGLVEWDTQENEQTITTLEPFTHIKKAWKQAQGEGCLAFCGETSRKWYEFIPSAWIYAPGAVLIGVERSDFNLAAA